VSVGADAPQREVRLEGGDNFRDLGGYPVPPRGRVRWRQLFRSGSLHRLSPADVALLRDELGVRLVVDLRSRWEHEAAPGVLGAAGVEVVEAPLRVADRDAAEAALSAGDLAAYYAQLLTDSTAIVADVVARIADADGAAVVHCAAGKDRTGVVAAVLLGTLGVPDEHVVADYALTESTRAVTLRRLGATAAYRERMAALPEAALRAHPETMHELLARLRAQHGSVDGYLRAAGLDPSVPARLRERLVEPLAEQEV